jgi:hypothetical protein
MKRKLLLTAGLSLLPILFGVLWFALPTDPINAANFGRIDIGMTEQEIVQLLGPRDPEDENIQQEVQGNWRTKAECWSRPSRGTVRDTILVGFRLQDGQWIVENKYCFIPSHWDRIKAWWGGNELLPDRLLPHQRPGGRTKRLESGA